MIDKIINRGAKAERIFDNSVDKAYEERRKQLLKELAPFIRKMQSINADADRLFEDGDTRKSAWKHMKRRDAVVAFKVKEKIEKALNDARKSCEKRYTQALFEIGVENLMSELEGVLNEDI